jgi:hypothetical protein
MTVQVLDKGYRVVGALVNMAAAGNANAVAAYRVSNWANQIGTKSFKIRKIRIRDNGTGGTHIHIGTGAAGAVVDVMPAIDSLSGLEGAWAEVELPEVEFFTDMMVYPVAVGASTIDIQVEGEEIG